MGRISWEDKRHEKDHCRAGLRVQEGAAAARSDPQLRRARAASPPDLVKQHGKRVIDSTFAMLGMAGSAIETIEDLAGYAR